jgi:hypothetical protein
MHVAWRLDQLLSQMAVRCRVCNTSWVPKGQHRRHGLEMDNWEMVETHDTLLAQNTIYA